jgi:hypothetical protein
MPFSNKVSEVVPLDLWDESVQLTSLYQLVQISYILILILIFFLFLQNQPCQHGDQQY